MKRFVCFLLLLSLSVPLCSCRDNTTEVSAIKIDIIAIMEELSALKQENEELKAEIQSLHELINILHLQNNDTVENPISAVSETVPSESDSYDDSFSQSLNEDFETQSTIESAPPILEDSPVLPEPGESPIPQPENSQPVVSEPEMNSQISDTVEVNTIYITKSGSKYHFSSNCGSGTYFESTLTEALAKGLTPCKKCAN